jgi:ParB/RepB/Spo0J family partition protein
MATTTSTATDRTAQLQEIHVAENVRALDPDHVRALAGSIRLQGMLVPVVVCPAAADVALGGWTLELVAGFHRVAAAAELRLAEIPVVIREADTEAAAATENIARKQLNPYEEARAVNAMLETGLSEDGAAQALGWPKQRVTARVKLLELPEQAQQLTGSGVIPLAAVEQLRTIGQVSPKLLDVLVDHVATEPDGWAGRQLATDPARALSDAMRHSDTKVFAAYLNMIASHEIEQLRLGKKTDELYAEAEKLHKQIDRYAYGPPPVRFTEQDVDEARAAGVLLELERSEAIIVDRPLYRELAKGAVRRTTEQLRVKAAAAKLEKSSVKANAGAPVDPVADARREHGRELRELADQAHGANLDLGRGLMNGLATVDPSDINVARLMVLCRRRHSTYYADAAAMPTVDRCAVNPQPTVSASVPGIGSTCRPRRLISA